MESGQRRSQRSGEVLASQPNERQLRATALKGNTLSPWTLEPVQLNLGKDKTVIKAGLTRDYGRQQLRRFPSKP